MKKHLTHEDKENLKRSEKEVKRLKYHRFWTVLVILVVGLICTYFSMDALIHPEPDAVVVVENSRIPIIYSRTKSIIYASVVLVVGVLALAYAVHLFFSLSRSIKAEEEFIRKKLAPPENKAPPGKSYNIDKEEGEYYDYK